MRSNRRLAPIAYLLGVVVAALLGLAALVSWQQLPHAVAPPPAIPLATDKSLGVNTDLSLLDSAERERLLSAMEQGDLNWIRQPFPWDLMEPEAGQYDWALWDAVVSDIVRHNIKIVAVLDGTPAWARSSENAQNPLAPPSDARAFGDWLAAFAARYADRIDYYQVWDEPNIAPHWGAGEIDPAAYARLLREGAIRIRTADPSATILAAALAPNVEPGGTNMSDLVFLEALYQAGAAEWFDVVAAQPYSFDAPVGAAPDPEQLNWQRVALLRDVIESHGDAETAVWAVSFGVSEGTSSAVSDAVLSARQQWPWLGPMLWAAWSPDDVHGQYALLDPAGRPGRVYEALSALAASASVAWPGVYPADHASGQYEGDWRVTPYGADIGACGDRLTISFWGTHLDLIVRRGDYRAFLYVTVDGQLAGALPADDQGQAYVVLYDPLGQTQRVTVAEGLVPGEHIAQVVAERGWGQWAIQGWSVTGNRPQALPWLPAMLALAAMVALGFTVYHAWPVRQSIPGALGMLQARYRTLDPRLILVLTAGAALLVYLMPGTVAALAALVLLGVLLLLSPEAGLPLIAFSLPFYQLGRPLLGKVFSMVEILTLFTALAWLANWLLTRLAAIKWPAGTQPQAQHSRLDVPRDPRARLGMGSLTLLDWGVVALVLVGAASLLWAGHLREAAREFRTVVLEAGIFYGLLRAMVRGRRELWRVADAWVLGGMLIAAIGLFQWAFGQNLITAEGVWRVRGFYGSPNNLALYLGRLLPVGVAIAAWGASGGVGPTRRRWYYAVSALLSGVVIVLTYSRGAWLVGVPASLLFLAALRGRRVLAATVAGLLVFAVVLLLVVGPGRLLSLADTTAGTTFFRLQLWHSSWNMIQDHPLRGVGLDNFLYEYRSFYVLPTAWEEFNLSHPHNVVLDFWLRLGLPGVVLILLLLVAFFRRGWAAYRRLPDGMERMLALGLMGSMVSFAAHGLVDNAFFLVDLAFAFMIALALVQVVDRPDASGI
ncbi:MAG: O-antigen ligase [Anaerolineae bacterium]|jgi:O-antigen ligase